MAYKVQLPPQKVDEQYLSGSPIPEQVVTVVTVVTSSPTEYASAATELGAAYRRYWNLPETAEPEEFRAVYAEIARLEKQAPPEIAWRTLRETATAYHSETGVCPFCRVRGLLHLPAEQPELELSGGQQ